MGSSSFCGNRRRRDDHPDLQRYWDRDLHRDDRGGAAADFAVPGVSQPHLIRASCPFATSPSKVRALSEAIKPTHS